MDLGTGNLRGMPGISVLKFENMGKQQQQTGVGGGDGGYYGDVNTVAGAKDTTTAEETEKGEASDPDLVRYHRDYLPDGKIWENAPIVGPLVKFQRETYMACMLSEGGCADLLGAPK